MTPERLALIKPGDYIGYGDHKHSAIMRVTHVEGDVIVGRRLNGYAASTNGDAVLGVASGFAPVAVGEFSDLGNAVASDAQFVAVRWDNGHRDYVAVDEALLWEERSITNADR